MLLLATLCVISQGLGEALSVCEALNQSNEINGKQITVRGFLQGSPRHGYWLYSSREAHRDPCRGWPTRFLTAPAIIGVGEPIAGTRGPDEYRDLVIEMNHRYSADDYSSMEVEAEGILVSKWPLLIIRKQDGSYMGNGYGQYHDLAAVLHLRSIRKVQATKQNQ